jgi:hypothetical protein
MGVLQHHCQGEHQNPPPDLHRLDEFLGFQGLHMVFLVCFCIFGGVGPIELVMFFVIAIFSFSFQKLLVFIINLHFDSVSLNNS